MLLIILVLLLVLVVFPGRYAYMVHKRDLREKAEAAKKQNASPSDMKG